MLKIGIMLVKSQIKYIQTLSQKKSRDAEGVFVAEGPKTVEEFLRAPNLSLRGLYATPSWCSAQASLLASLPADQVYAITEKELERISLLTTPHEVLGVFEKPRFPEQGSDRHTLTLLLDTLQDPGNLGTIIRCADWFGLRKVVCSEDSADAFNPKVVQASMGSLARVQVVYHDLEHYLQQQPLPVYAAVTDGTPIAKVQKPAEGYLLIGNESRGIHPRLLKKQGTLTVTIPRKGKAESLNAAVAAGILLSYLT